MRLRAAIALSAMSAGLGMGLVACFDLFHSTSGILDQCEIDAASCGDAAPPVDFCSWEAGTPQTAAAIACTWIDTCEGTIDQDNDFGECMLRARLVYDCAANQNNPVTGAAKQAWLGLLQAKSCSDVDAIEFPNGKPPCSPQAAGHLGCDDKLVTAVYCPAASGRPFADNCALWNQTCNPGTGCDGCLGCFAGTDSGVCTPDASASCSQDTAWSCPNGSLEAINCGELLGLSGTCNSGPLVGQDPTSPCYLDAGAADAADGGATGCVEGCSDSGTLTACARGVSFPFDCSSIDAGCQETDAGASCVFQQDQ